MDLLDTINGLNNMILSYDTKSEDIDVLKSARKVLENIYSGNIKREVLSDIENKSYVSEKQRETSSNKFRKYTVTNPYKQKSSGKPGKRCVHCDHFNKYSQEAIKRTQCLGRCTLFDIQVRDCFNGCSQDNGNIKLHNFDEDQVERAIQNLISRDGEGV